MNFEQAREIFNSPEFVEVLYNGNSVWIEALNPDHQTAVISSDTFPERKKTVPLEQLVDARE